MKRTFIRFEANKKGFIRLFHIKANQRILRAKRIKTKANILLISYESEYFEANEANIFKKNQILSEA